MMDANKARKLAAQAEAKKMFRLADALKLLAGREEAAQKTRKKVLHATTGHARH